MGSHVRWNLQTVLEFVNHNSETTLLSTEFKTAKTKMKFRCKCGNFFDTTFERFRLRDKRHCNECGFRNQLEKQSLSYDEVKEFIEDNGCELIDTVYINTKEKLNIKCVCRKIFKKSFEKFKAKSPSCSECSFNKISESQTFTFDEVNTFVFENSNCKLLSKNYIGGYEKLNFLCGCGESFSTNFNSFKHSKQRTCKKCSNAQSRGEQFIESFLLENKLEFNKQYSFDNLLASNKRQKLRFDFAVFKNDKIKLIEFDGKQHFTPVDYFGGMDAFNVLKANDAAKNNYCNDNHIELIRIPYYEIDNINTILESSL